MVIAVIVYLSAFSLVIRGFISGKKSKVGATNANAEPPKPADKKEGGQEK